MKAVIFSCSPKQAKWSTTKAWADLMKKRLALKQIVSKVIHLRDYDYEASVDKDDLHEQMKYVYDADLIILSSPENIDNPTFTFANLLERFVHAHKNAQSKGIDIFADKMYEYCYMNATFRERNWNNHWAYIFKTLPFIKHLGLKNLNISTRGPKWQDGPTVDTMESYQRIIAVCDNIVDTFIDNKKGTTLNVPKCTLEEFMEFFKSNEPNAFGRGMTIAEERINKKSVEAHIKYVNDTVENSVFRGNIFMCMKERCMRLGYYELAEKYYDQQYMLAASDEQYDGVCTGNFRSNGY